ncbi:hypothetical protein [Verminephrobacter eiseniae]|uniref:hypothetical protein n=1 Tax=Verminephrobacter eiseniae TaxID=364317 RepID=UPI002237A257|nr:hypothetical protein [Verminephrobacter eiseniae]MCW5230831.1 hypothetical protein [Verminephrobacter eiseniae]MCW5292562.1 hypothetical protein [Verminephrobacter eiseniae]MCW8188124.1 hypothetical protein [Verminephrobacter eiseniae]MCW8226387.1 hypothetical protein [Verminephrobacter eiseniae]MCW8237160.1 hypothetical protein [Verminephrobacter eiseniae]
MGLFDFFGKKKKEDADAAELLKAIVQFQVEARADGVDTDDIPKAYGPFGLCKTNPIPTRSVAGSNAYLESLRTKDGRRVTANRMGSTSAEDVTSGMIDIYQLSADGQPAATIYVCPYHKRNSAKAPDGFYLA